MPEKSFFDCKMIDRILKSGDQFQHAKKLFAVSYRSTAVARTIVVLHNLVLSKGVRGYQIHDEMALVWRDLDKLAMALEELVKNVEFGPDPTHGIKVNGLIVLDDTSNVPKA
jgi:hypothetical protein